MRRRKGFTLIELLVVIAIIGMLSSIVLASLNSARSKARDAARMAQARQLQNAVELYHNDRGTYPGNTNWFDNSCRSDYADINSITTGYIQLPADPGGTCTNALYYTGTGGLPGGYPYYIIFTPENTATLSNDDDCYIPSTYYCVTTR